MDRAIIDGLSYAMPLFIIALGGIFSEQSGITNLALEGLLGFGAFVGGMFLALSAGMFSLGSSAPMYMAFFMAMAGGLVYSLLHALLCIQFKADQVISGVVVNILSVAMTSFFTKQINQSVFGNPSDKFQFGVLPRITIPALSEIPVLGAVFTNVYPFQIIILVLAAVAWYLMYRTRFGIRLRACGDNPQAVDAAGVSVKKIRFAAVMISGALSGLGGMCFAYSISTNFSASIYFGSGYLAIAALIFGNWKIAPTFAACLLFGFARSGASEMMRVLAIPNISYLSMTIPYLLTLIVLAFFAKSSRAPRALGRIYDKGAR